MQPAALASTNGMEEASRDPSAEEPVPADPATPEGSTQSPSTTPPTGMSMHKMRQGKGEGEEKPSGGPSSNSSDDERRVVHILASMYAAVQRENAVAAVRDVVEVGGAVEALPEMRRSDVARWVDPDEAEDEADPDETEDELEEDVRRRRAAVERPLQLSKGATVGGTHAGAPPSAAAPRPTPKAAARSKGKGKSKPSEAPFTVYTSANPPPNTRRSYGTTSFAVSSSRVASGFLSASGPSRATADTSPPDPVRGKRKRSVEDGEEGEKNGEEEDKRTRCGRVVKKPKWLEEKEKNGK